MGEAGEAGAEAAGVDGEGVGGVGAGEGPVGGTGNAGEGRLVVYVGEDVDLLLTGEPRLFDVLDFLGDNPFVWGGLFRCQRLVLGKVEGWREEAV